MPFNENKRKQARPDKKQLRTKIEDRTKLLKAAFPSKTGITTKQLAKDTGVSRPVVNKWMRNAPDSFVKEGSFNQIESNNENIWIPNPIARYKGEKEVRFLPVEMGSLDLPPHSSGQDLIIYAKISGMHHTQWVEFGLNEGRKRIDLRLHSGEPSLTETFWTNVGGQQSIPIRAQGVNENGQCAIDVEAIRLPSNIDHDKLCNTTWHDPGELQGGFENEKIPLILSESDEIESSQVQKDNITKEDKNDESSIDNGWINCQRIVIWSDGNEGN